MAKVKMPLLSGQASGKLGGIVFLVRRGQQIARMRTRPANPNTEKQRVVRQNFTGLSNLWKGIDNQVLKRYDAITGQFVDYPVQNALTEQEKQAWEMYATQTLKKYPSYGRLAFLGENIKRLRAGMDIKRTP